MISSVPYVPPDTMKNVAATSGQSVSFAILFFAVEIVRVGMWAGSDNVLNFYPRPPKRSSLSLLLLSEFAFAEYRVRLGMQEKNALPQIIFSPVTPVLSYSLTPPIAFHPGFPGLTSPQPV